MSGGPGPRGISLGLMKCISKSKPIGSKIVLVFSSNGNHCSVHLEPEDADYFTVGQSYSFAATAP